MRYYKILLIAFGIILIVSCNSSRKENNDFRIENRIKLINELAEGYYKDSLAMKFADSINHLKNTHLKLPYFISYYHPLLKEEGKIMINFHSDNVSNIYFKILDSIPSSKLEILNQILRKKKNMTHYDSISLEVSEYILARRF